MRLGHEPQELVAARPSGSSPRVPQHARFLRKKGTSVPCGKRLANMVVMEFFLHPMTATLVMSAILIAMQVLGQVALARLTPEQAKEWPAYAHTALMAVLLAVVVVPTVNNLWAERRDEQNEQRARQREDERQQREVRDAHLERLRPLLRNDSKKLLQLSSQVAVEGTAMGGWLVDDYEPRLDSDYWYPELLYRDLRCTFSRLRQSPRAPEG